VTDPDIYKQLREKMVDEQIISRGITDKNVLSAILAVERHKFVPENLIRFAYSDEPLSIGGGQTISQPYIVAIMTELLHPEKTDRILEIGTGSGYQAAVLSLLCEEVYTVEINPVLAAAAEKLFEECGYKNVRINIGDGYSGWTEFAPYDKIIFTCAPPDVPKQLINQLKEGGLMTGPIGGGLPQELILAAKIKGRLIKKNIFSVSFVPMVKGQDGER